MSWREVQAARLRELGYTQEQVEEALQDFEEPEDVPDESLETRRYEPANAEQVREI